MRVEWTMPVEEIHRRGAIHPLRVRPRSRGVPRRGSSRVSLSSPFDFRRSSTRDVGQGEQGRVRHRGGS